MNTELIELPQNWKWTTLGDIADVVGGGTPKTNDPSNYEGGTIPWITPADLSGYTAKHIAHGARFITKKGLEESSAKMMPAGTVLFTSRAPIGYVAIASNPVCTNQGFKSFVLKNGILPDYVYWWLKRSKDLAESMASGTTFLELSGAKAKQIPVPVAPLDQQKHIVAEIEKQFSRLDEAVANLKRVKANLKRYKAAVLKAAVEGRLVETEAEIARREGRSYETGAQLLQRILETRRSQWKGKGKYKEPAAPDTTDLPELPEGWVWASVEQLGNIETGGTPPKSDAANYGTEVPFVKPPELLNKPVSTAGDNLSAKGAALASIAPPNSILISCIGNLGKTAITTRHVAFNQQINAILPILPETARWIFYVAQESTFRDQLESVASATTISIVNKSKFSGLFVPLAPAHEQHRVVDEVERRFSLVEGLESVVSVNLQRAERLRQSILGSAFTGTLNVSELSRAASA